MTSEPSKSDEPGVNRFNDDYGFIAAGGTKDKPAKELPLTGASGSLGWLAAPVGKSPVDDVVGAHSAALAQAFRGSLAPVRQIILNSTSRADAEQKLKLFFTDWKPQRIASIVDEAMQLCAAKGAVKALQLNDKPGAASSN